MIYVLNFKTYLKTLKEHLRIYQALKKLKGNHELWLALNPYFYFPLRKKLKSFKIGLQNLAPILEKPQTGETLYDFELIKKADFILLGHSERYRLGENLKIIKQKIDTLQEKKIKLVIFFSENSYTPSKNFQRVKNKIQENLSFLLKDLKKKNFPKVYLCYEPWWAISSERGQIPSKEFLEEFLSWYRKTYNFPIFYGGSYNSKLKEDYRDLNFDGFVLGKASTEIKELKNLLA